MQRRRTPAFIGPGLVLAAIACTETRNREPIYIAATISETGLRSTPAIEMENGYRLAVEVLNFGGGIQGREVELVTANDESDPDVAVRHYHDFVQRVDLLLGPYGSPVTAPVLDVTEAAGIPLVAPLAATPTIWAGKGRQWSVQMLPPAPAYLQGSVEIAAVGGARTVALVYEDSQYAASLASGVREAADAHGLEIVLDRAYPEGEADYTVLASAARDAGGDLFIGGGYYEDAIGLTRAVSEVGYEPLLISLSLGPADPRFADELGGLARCVTGYAPWIHTIGTSGFIAESDRFVERYGILYGRPPGYHAAAGFGAVELMAEAIDAVISPAGNFDRAAVRDHLFSFTTETILGPFGVYPPGDAQAGAQRVLKGLQVQWQDDGEGGLVQRIVHPEAVAQAEPCFSRQGAR
ncbi:MAG: amino acid ABC transporter substrate-binding protein [Gemmatimonadota bacterium]|nr:amino acid ABC transporter substrate-binding protein [Gemmatimonadota bacterium]